MTTQGVLVEAVFSGLTGEVGNFANQRLSGGRVAFHPSGGGNTYKNVYASATVSGSTLLDQSVNQGILLDGSGSAEVYAVGHYLCKAYDSEGVLQRTFDLRIGSVTSDSSGDSAVSTSTLNIKTSYGTNASDINDAITYANANSANSFVFLFEDANFTVENNMVFPSNVTIQVEPTAKLMIYAGVNSVTINGAIKHDFNQVFKYENNTTCTITIDPQFTEQIYPQWFGAVPDGTSDSSFLVTKALATGIKRLVLAGGDFKLNSNITIPSDVEIIRKGGADFTLANGVTITGLGTKATVFDKVEVKQDIIPTTTETSDIGSSTKKIQKIYTKNIDVDSILQILSQLKLGDGTLSSLSLSAIADPNTGLYFPSADILTLVTGGVERMRIGDSEGIVTLSSSTGHDAKMRLTNAGGNVKTGQLEIGNYGPGGNGFNISGGTSGGLIDIRSINEGTIAHRLANYLNNSWKFYTNNALRMMIDSSGNVGIGTSSTDYKTDIEVDNTNDVVGMRILGNNRNDKYVAMRLATPSHSTSGGEIRYKAYNATSFYYGSMKFNINGPASNNDPQDILELRGNGKVFMPGLAASGSGTNVIINPSTGELYEETSSLKFKEKVEDIKIDTSKIYDIQPRTYIRKESDIEEIGFIAEEVNELIPDVVSFKNDAPYSINYSKLVVPIIAEMKKLKAEIKELKEKISALEKNN